MPVDFSSAVYANGQDVFGRPITVFPLKSQPGMPEYNARGIFDTAEEDLPAEDQTIFSDQHTIIDIRSAEFDVVPIQGDQIFVPAAGSIPARGMFVIIDVQDNGGGEITFDLRKVVDAKPIV